jgi:MFS family permease
MSMGTQDTQLAHPYRDIFGNVAFRRFWTGFTFSALGDAMTRVALIWYVFQTTHAPQAVGGLLLCYTGPVVVGGLVAGTLLDRFDRRRVMFFDNLIRGAAVVLIPLLSATGHLALWHAYAVAAVYGFLFMLTLAGGPSLIPSLVSPSQLATANALETLSFTVSGVLGPPLAGLLITWIGAPNVILLDALSYGAFALALASLSVPAEHSTSPAEPSHPTAARVGMPPLGAALRLLVSNATLLATTLMFMSFNVGEGMLFVWLPLLAAHGGSLLGIQGDGSTLYGVFLGALALGEMAGALVAGSRSFPLALGSLICLAQALSGAGLALMLVQQSPLWVIVALLLLGLFSAPLTIWAQTLRMRIIPEALRGRTFALLRTLMQSTGPLASAAAGFLLPLVGLTAMIACSALFAGAPGLAGLRVGALHRREPSVMLETKVDVHP